MQFSAGARLGPYEVLSAVGAGGMGEVYRARDTRLDRTVAIKILLDGHASDPQFRDRFDREARSISALEHPHVCALYDVGEHQDRTYLVMPYVDGETLAQRIDHAAQRGQAIEISEALAIGMQIASALDAAHRRGIVHRDLKPGNVILTKGREASRLRPRQVVYGSRPHAGQSSASVIGSILREAPPPVSRVATLSPPALDRVVAKCLVKDPDRRWQSASDLGDELRWIAEGEAGSSVPASKQPSVSRRAAIVGAVLVAAAASAATALWTRRAPVERDESHPTRLAVVLPPGVSFDGSPAISPDGARIVFVGRSAGRAALWVRDLDALQARVLPGSDDAVLPFWSARWPLDWLLHGWLAEANRR